MKTTKKKSRVHWLCWVIAAIFFICGAVGIITVCLLHSQESQLPYNYAIAVDGGSSRTDFYVYRWPTQKENGTGIVEQIYKCPNGSEKKLPFLASLASTPENAGPLIVKPCMDKILSVIPSTDYSTTPVFLGATAGMRVLKAYNDQAAEAILASVRSALASYPFQFTQPLQQARIISGGEEGAFGWVTSNYLAGSFGVSSQQTTVGASTSTVGALDMGGASTQVAFESADSDGSGAEDSAEAILLYGRTYDVYSHSYLCYGFDEANRKYKALLVQNQNFSRIIDDPCSPLGNESLVPFTTVFQEPCTSSAKLPDYAKALANQSFVFRGLSNSELCRNLTLGIFNTSAPCSQPPCTFDGVHQPTVNGKFLAFSGYFLSVSDIGLNPSAGFSIPELRTAIDTFCNKTWNEISGMGKPEPILIILCFQNQHIYHMLVDIYGFNDSTWNNVKIVNKISGSDFGWVLGMTLNATNAIPSHAVVTPLDERVFVPLLLTFSALVLVSFLAVVMAMFLWLRRKR